MAKRKDKAGDYIQIHAFWGSDFARKSGMDALSATLKAWVKFYTEQNKENEIVVEMRDHPYGRMPFVIFRPKKEK